ncbi:unnamed protein product, partial [marine sediment metagenome]
FIWGGRNDWSEGLNTGARYDPATDTWTNATTIGTLPGRARPSVVWTGDKALIWGGSAGEEQYYQTGAIYDYPHTIPYWTATPIASAPDARRYHTAIWTVTTAIPQGELIIWGGMSLTGKFNTGKRYRPSIDVWVSISTDNAPSIRWGHTAVWTGTEMIVWGGFQGGSYDAPSNPLNTGACYDPVLDAWTPITDTDSDTPMGRGHHTAVWTGSEMIIWGGLSEMGEARTALDTGACYNPISD